MPTALDNLYQVFGRYPRPKTFRACGCCFDGAVIEPTGWNGTSRPIVEVVSPGGDEPVRELTAAVIDGLIGDVPLTSGDTALLKHYLPRAFELALDDETLIGPFAIWGSIWWSEPPRVVPWTEWPKEEQDAIDAFMLEAWTEHSGRDDACEISDVLDGLIHAARDMQPFLDIWLTTDSDPLHRQEVFDWNERPGEHSHNHCRRNWETTKRWLSEHR